MFPSLMFAVYKKIEEIITTLWWYSAYTFSTVQINEYDVKLIWLSSASQSNSKVYFWTSEWILSDNSVWGDPWNTNYHKELTLSDWTKCFFWCNSYYYSTGWYNLCAWKIWALNQDWSTPSVWWSYGRTNSWSSPHNKFIRAYHMVLDWVDYITMYYINTSWTTTTRKWNPTTKLWEWTTLPAHIWSTQWHRIIYLSDYYISSRVYWRESPVTPYNTIAIPWDKILYISWQTLWIKSYTTDMVTTTEVIEEYFDFSGTLPEWVTIKNFRWEKIWTTIYVSLLWTDNLYYYYSWPEWSLSFGWNKYILWNDWVSIRTVEKEVYWNEYNIKQNPMIWEVADWEYRYTVWLTLYRI